MSKKIREGKHQHLSHHGLIKLIVVDSLKILRIHVLWFKFIDMDREIFIETQALTPGETRASSVGGREEKIEKKKQQGQKKNKER